MEQTQATTVSIITPSYNQGQYIEATILSVLQQDYAPIEYLVMDGGSTDQTVEVLRRYEGKLAWISQKDGGQADAVNKGVARTRGELLGWLNSDDTYAPGAVSAAVEYLRAHPDVSVVYGDADFIDEHGRFIGHCAHIEPFSRPRLVHYSDFIVQPAAFIRREAFEAVGGLDASLNWAMDYDLWLKLAGRFKFGYLPRVLANYRWFGTNKTGIGGHARIEEVRQVARRHGARRLPAYFRLEQIALHLQEMLEAARRLRPDRAALACLTGMGRAISSPRAMRSLLSPQTWRIIWMGQVLRHRARMMKRGQQAVGGRPMAGARTG